MANQDSHAPRLSVVIIARDAAHRLEETLASAARLSDEIIVCDTGSSDQTREIARSAGCTVVAHRWTNDFSAARNVALQHATGDWVLWLDAGERLADEDARALRVFVETQADLARVYMLLVLVPPAANNISGEQVGRIRLMPNRRGLKFTGRVRETLKHSLPAAGITTVDGLPWRILRSQRDNDPQVKLARAKRDLHLLELEISERGQLPDLLVALGESMTIAHDLPGALACYRKALQDSTPGDAVQREIYYGLLTALDQLADGMRQSQICIAVEALERFPLDAQILCAMGGYMQAEGRIDMAMRAYQTAVEYGQVDPEIWHVPDIFDIAAACLSLAHQLQNNDEAATKVLTEALARNPQATRLRRQLIDLHVRHDRRKEALAEFEQLPANMPHREAFRSAIRGACLASKNNWTPAMAYLQTSYDAGCRDVLCLRWLALAQLSTGNTNAARSTLRLWQSIEPRSTEVQGYLDSLEPSEHHGSANDASPSSGVSRHFRVDAPSAPERSMPKTSPAAGTINIYGVPGAK